MVNHPHRLLYALLLLASHCSPGGAQSDASGGRGSTGGLDRTGGALATGGLAPQSGGFTSSGGANQTGGGPLGGEFASGGTANTGGSSAGGSSAGGSSAGGSSAGGSSAGGRNTGGSSQSSGASGAASGGGGEDGQPTAGGGMSAGGRDTGGAAGKGGATSSGGASTAGGAHTGGSGPLVSLTVYIASDSTAQTYTNSAIHQAGWGQYLQSYLDPKAKVDNRAIGGRTARRFIDEGYLDKILQVIKPGDYLLVQFGTNDGNQTATYTLNGQTIPYYLAPASDFKTWMTRYVTAARDHMANPVFVTPPPRRSCSGDSHSFGNGLAAYATAMKELGAAQSVPVVDLNQKTLSYLNGIGCVAAGADFFLVNADGSVDGTHFQEKGANALAGFVATGLRELGFGLSPYVK